MYILPQDAQLLQKLGFKRTRFDKEIQPFDIYYFDKQIFVLGGQILPQESIFALDEIYKKGILLPSINDLEWWLKDHALNYEIESKGLNYRITAYLPDQTCFKAKGGSLTQIFFNIIIVILESKKILSKKDSYVFKVDSIE